MNADGCFPHVLGAFVFGDTSRTYSVLIPLKITSFHSSAIFTTPGHALDIICKGSAASHSRTCRIERYHRILCVNSQRALALAMLESVSEAVSEHLIGDARAAHGGERSTQEERYSTHTCCQIGVSSAACALRGSSRSPKFPPITSRRQAIVGYSSKALS
jgi:hypothetical protein